jgi:hypothetical protein
LLDELWRLLAEDWPSRVPRASLRDQIGEDALAWLEGTRSVREVSLLDAGYYPCPRPLESFCARRLAWEPEPVAYCGLPHPRCARERLAPADTVALEIDAQTLAPMLRRSLNLAEGEVVEDDVVFLGERPFGTRRVGFVLAPWPQDRSTRRWLEQAAWGAPRRVLVVLAFHRGQLSGGVPLERPGVEWMALSEARPRSDGLTFDLMDLWDTYAPEADPAGDWWPRYLFVADPARARFWYAGQPLPLERRPQACRLLTALLWNRGQWLSRHQQLRVIYPEESPAQHERLASNVRQVKRQLSEAFETLMPRAGVLSDPVETLPMRSDTVGGYRIEVPGGRIRWLSRPDADILHESERADPGEPHGGRGLPR